MTRMSGGCACGQVRYEADIANDEAYLCHCRMCQRAAGAISLALCNVKKADVRWEREPDRYASSPIAERGFCSRCGTSLTFEFTDSENMDLTVASFDEAGHFVPHHHFGWESHHPAWIDTSGLPTYRADEHKPTVDRWMEKVGKLPD